MDLAADKPIPLLNLNQATKRACPRRTPMMALGDFDPIHRMLAVTDDYPDENLNDSSDDLAVPRPLVMVARDPPRSCSSRPSVVRMEMEIWVPRLGATFVRSLPGRG